MNSRYPRLALISLAGGVILIAIFAGMLLQFRAELRDDIHRKIIERAAANLRPEANQQLVDAEAANPPGTSAAALLPAVLKTAAQEGMLAVTVFDAEGTTVQALPASLLLAELPAEDFSRLLGGESISRYRPDFPAELYFAGLGGRPEERRIPVLEILLPLHGRDAVKRLGFVQYYLDARALARELAAIDARVSRQTFGTLALGSALIAAVVLGAYIALRRAQVIIAERNRRLIDANLELTLSAKASALGQITSNLIHGLQGSVAGLRAVVAEQRAERSTTLPAWENAGVYTERLQGLIESTVAMLGEARTHTLYDLDGRALAESIERRSSEIARSKGTLLEVRADPLLHLDSHRGSLVCLIIATSSTTPSPPPPPAARLRSSSASNAIR